MNNTGSKTDHGRKGEFSDYIAFIFNFANGYNRISAMQNLRKRQQQKKFNLCQCPEEIAYTQMLKARVLVQSPK